MRCAAIRFSRPLPAARPARGWAKSKSSVARILAPTLRARPGEAAARSSNIRSSSSAGPWRVARSHSPCFAQIALTRSAAANSPRSACASVSSNDASSYTVRGIDGCSSPASCGNGLARSSCVSSGSARTVFTAWSRRSVMFYDSTGYDRQANAKRSIRESVARVMLIVHLIE